MTPQTTFATGINPWLNAVPTGAAYGYEPQRSVAPPPVFGALEPRIGCEFRTRGGFMVAITGKTRHGQFCGNVIGKPDDQHSWQPNGVWGRYRQETPYDLLEFRGKAAVPVSTARKLKRGKYDDKFASLRAGDFLACGPGEATQMKKSMDVYFQNRGYTVLTRKRGSRVHVVVLTKGGAA